jgi:hypothetical protein
MEQDRLNADRRFEELMAHIRFTDEISFKLLGLVPLLTVAAIAAVLLKGEVESSVLLLLLSLFAATITWALFAWELRNIQTCSWCRHRAAEIESDFGELRLSVGHFSRFPEAFLRLGKTAAEKVVYSSTILGWLLLPVAAAMQDSGRPPVETLPWRIYLFGAVVVAVATVLLVLAPTPLKPKRLKDSRERTESPNPATPADA